MEDQIHGVGFAIRTALMLGLHDEQLVEQPPKIAESTELPASLHCRPTSEKPEKNCRAGCRERKRISIEATSLQGCPKNFFFFFFFFFLVV